MNKISTYKWFVENIDEWRANIYAVESCVAHIHTQHQEVEIIKTPAFGKALVVDGRLQTSESDEFVYHEVLVHSGLVGLSGVESIMIVGGGPGATLREALRYRSVRRILMVDIDKELVELCRAYLPDLNAGAFVDPRVEVRYEDAAVYLQKSTEKFDAIIVDLTAPISEGPSELLWTEGFYRLAIERLKPGGVMTTHGGPLTREGIRWPASVVRCLRKYAAKVFVLHAHIPCFGLANPWSFMVASRAESYVLLSQQDADARIRDLVGELRYLDGTTYVHAFTLPKYMRTALEKE